MHNIQIPRRQFLKLGLMAALSVGLEGCNAFSNESFQSNPLSNLYNFDLPDFVSRNGEYKIAVFNQNEDEILSKYIYPLCRANLISLDAENGKLYSSIADNFQEIDKLNYLFTLRNDAYFHSDKFGYASQITSGSIVNDYMNRLDTGDPFFKNVISSIKKINKYQILFTLKNPFPYFFEYISNSNIAGIRHPEFYDDFEINIGSGPFIPFKVNNNDYLLIANKFYFDKNLPLLDYIYITNYKSLDLFKNDYTNYKFDIILSNELIDSLAGIEDRYHLQTKPSKSLIYFGISIDQSKHASNINHVQAFQNTRVRLALAKSINRDPLLKISNGFFSGFIPPSFPLDSLSKDELLESNFMQYDLNIAKKLLSESGFSGLEFRIDLPNTNLFRKIGDLIREQLILTGFKPKLFFRGLEEIKSIFDTRDFESILSKIDFDITPDNGLLINTARGVNDQFSPWGFSSPIYDYEVQESFYENNPIKRGLLSKKAQKILLDQTPSMIPLFCNSEKGLISTNTNGFQYNKLDSNFNFYSKYWIKNTF